MSAMMPMENRDAPGGPDNDDAQAAVQSALDTFGLYIAEMRRDAIQGRYLLGVEDEWQEDEDAYQGIDDANRHEFRSAMRQRKPTATGQKVTTPPTSTKCTLLPNITRPYVDAAAARMSDMLLPNDDRCWDVEATPIPDLADTAKAETDEMVLIDAEQGLEVNAQVWAKTILDVADARVERARKRMEDWFEEGHWTSHARQVIEQAARLGTGVLKGPFSKRKRKVSWHFVDGQFGGRQVSTERVPHSTWVDVWNCFPDPACGENIQHGSFFFERDSITKRQMLDLKTQPGYIPHQIDACLKEGPIQAEVMWTPTMELERQTITNNTLYEVWYFEGLVELAQLELCGLDCSHLKSDESGEPQTHAAATITMINHRVVRASLTGIDDGTFPYDVYVWQKRPGMWCGMGIARQIRTAQRSVTAAYRNLHDNAAVSAGAQIIVDSDQLKPADGSWEIRGLKAWIRTGNSEAQLEPFDAQKAFQVATIDCRQAELMNIIDLGLRMAEESTGLPMILQGQVGEKDVDTLGGMRLLNNNATSVLRRLAKQFDDQITVPHVTRYYHWLMEFGPADEEKGDFNVVARGSSTLVERDIQNQEFAVLIELSLRPEYGVDPYKAAQEWMRSRHIDPKRVQLTEEEMEAQQQSQPQDPRIQAAAIAAEDKAAARQHDAEQKQADRAAKAEQALLDKNTDVAKFNAQQAAQAEREEREEEAA